MIFAHYSNEYVPYIIFGSHVLLQRNAESSVLSDWQFSLKIYSNNSNVFTYMHISDKQDQMYEHTISVAENHKI